MHDQIKYEHRRYENLKTAILKEEAMEQNLYQPSINKKSVNILAKKGMDSSGDLFTNSLGEQRKRKKLQKL